MIICLVFGVLYRKIVIIGINLNEWFLFDELNKLDINLKLKFEKIEFGWKWRNRIVDLWYVVVCNKICWILVIIRCLD